MPIFTFECPKCKRRFEVYTAIRTSTNIPCPSCKSTAKKVPSLPGRPVIKRQA